MLGEMTTMTRAWRKRLAALALAPLVFLGTLPHSACHCDRGPHEAFCRVAPSGSKNAAAPAATRACCLARRAKSRRLDAPAEGGGQLPPRSGCGAPRATAPWGACCGKAWEPALPATLSDSTKITGGFDGLALAPVKLGIAVALADRCAFHLRHFPRATPPPLDAVIVYLHLTI
jgi:hypothetical protein